MTLMMESNMINFLKVTTIKIFFTSGLAIFSYLNIGYLDSLIFVSVSLNGSNISTCFDKFLDFLQPSLFNDRDAKHIKKVTYIVVVNITNTSTRNTYTRSIGAEDISSTKGTYGKDAFIGNAYTKNTYIRGANTIEYSKIHL